MFDVNKFIMFVLAIGFCGRSATEGCCAGVNWPQKNRLGTYGAPFSTWRLVPWPAKNICNSKKLNKIAHNVTRCGSAMNGAWRKCQHLPIKLNVCNVFINVSGHPTIALCTAVYHVFFMCSLFKLFLLSAALLRKRPH